MHDFAVPRPSAAMSWVNGFGNVSPATAKPPLTRRKSRRLPNQLVNMAFLRSGVRWFVVHAARVPIALHASRVRSEPPDPLFQMLIEKLEQCRIRLLCVRSF